MPVMTSEPYVISDSILSLHEISASDCSLAVWQRELPLEATDLLRGDPEDLRVTVPSHDPEAPLRGALDKCGFPEGDTRQELVEDMLTLCHLFRDLNACPSIEIRLEVVSGDSCWKFHCDYVEMRLITTYHGRGTQWLDQRNADRVTDGLEPEVINELRTGDVGLFKGRLGNGPPAIHRSPPIEGTGEKRLLLVLNPVNG
ncbi:MAG: DUF1826 domain-containing protein [Pseudomonadota bacterium]